jgi:hypothetical protein
MARAGGGARTIVTVRAAQAARTTLALRVIENLLLGPKRAALGYRYFFGVKLKSTVTGFPAATAALASFCPMASCQATIV